MNSDKLNVGQELISRLQKLNNNIDTIMTKPQTNKSSFRSETVNIHFFHKGAIYQDKYGVMFGPTKGHAHPPVSREQLKELADFIYEYLENN